MWAIGICLLPLLRILVAFALTGAFTATSYAQNGRSKRGNEEFDIISSVNQPRSQLLLKHPTEVTVLMPVGDNAQILDDQGKPARLNSLRAGDTVWVVSSGGSQPTATRIRKGPITVEQLHQLYLDYPVLK